MEKASGIADLERMMVACPHCHETTTLRVSGDWMSGYSVACECGVSGPNEEDEYAAVESWYAIASRKVSIVLEHDDNGCTSIYCVCSDEDWAKLCIIGNESSLDLQTVDVDRTQYTPIAKLTNQPEENR